jgi:hypothetical protein
MVSPNTFWIGFQLKVIGLGLELAILGVVV